MNRRELREEERRLLDYLLSVEFPGASELREQAAHVVVVEEFKEDATLSLVLRARETRRADTRSGVPVSAQRYFADGSVLDVLVQVRDGMLDRLEIAAYGRDLAGFPDPADLALIIAQ